MTYFSLEQAEASPTPATLARDLDTLSSQAAQLMSFTSYWTLVSLACFSAQQAFSEPSVQQVFSASVQTALSSAETLAAPITSAATASREQAWIFIVGFRYAFRLSQSALDSLNV